MTAKPNKTDNRHTVQPVPEGYQQVTPWIIVKDAAKLIDFLKEAFGAKETDGSRVYNQDGSIGHVEVRIGDSVSTASTLRPSSQPSRPPSRSGWPLRLQGTSSPFVASPNATTKTSYPGTCLTRAVITLPIRSPTCLGLRSN
jgi:hypothetical protein